MWEAASMVIAKESLESAKIDITRVALGEFQDRHRDNVRLIAGYLWGDKNGDFMLVSISCDHFTYRKNRGDLE